MFKRTCVRNNFEGFLYAHLLPKAWCEKLLFAVTFAFWVSFCLVPAALWAAEQSSVPTPSPAGTPADVKASTAHAPLKTTPIVVRFIVNTQPKGDFFAELDEHHHLYITPEDAQTLKLQYAEDKMVIIRQDEQYVPLSALLNVHYTFDEQKLTVTIVGKTTESAKTVADLFSLQAGTKNIYYPRETGAFINYGLNYAFTGEDGFQSFSLTNKVGFRTGDMFLRPIRFIPRRKTMIILCGFKVVLPMSAVRICSGWCSAINTPIRAIWAAR